MIPFLKAILWDMAAARAAVLAVATGVSLFIAQPVGRTLEERLLTAALGAVGTGAASAGSARSKAMQDELDALKARLDAIAGPK